MKIESYRDDGVRAFYAKDRRAWRTWLMDNHEKEEAVWIVFFKKGSGVPSINFDEALKEAICFGWIDSKPNKRDDKSYYQYFSRRNPKSNWSKVNKDLVNELQREGIMHQSGLAMVSLAKETGTWDALNDVDNLVVPEDLAQAFSAYPGSADHFSAFPRSVKRGILEWIFTAKRPETRKKRILETASMAAENRRANQYPRG